MGFISKFLQSYTTSQDGILVLVNAAADHIASSDCQIVANIIQMLALTSWLTLQTVLLKWQTNSLVILSRSDLQLNFLRPH